MNKVSLGAASGESSEECAKRDGHSSSSPAVALKSVVITQVKQPLLVRVIAELVSRGFDIGSIKHHGHCDFDIDVPGKDCIGTAKPDLEMWLWSPDARSAHHRTQP